MELLDKGLIYMYSAARSFTDTAAVDCTYHIQVASKNANSFDFQPLGNVTDDRTLRKLRVICLTEEI